MVLHHDLHNVGGGLMKRIEKILLCGNNYDGTQFLYITDGEKAYIYYAWNKKQPERIRIPATITDAEGNNLAVECISWNAITAQYTRIVNKSKAEMLENTELT